MSPDEGSLPVEPLQRVSLSKLPEVFASFINPLHITIIPVAQTEISPFNEDSANHLPQALLLRDL